MDTYTRMVPGGVKPVRWVGSSRRDLKAFPTVKALKGFGGRSVRFRDAIYVLHAFQKKSTHGIATSQQDIDLIRQRLAVAERDVRERQSGR